MSQRAVFGARALEKGRGRGECEKYAGVCRWLRSGGRRSEKRAAKKMRYRDVCAEDARFGRGVLTSSGTSAVGSIAALAREATPATRHFTA